MAEGKPVGLGSLAGYAMSDSENENDEDHLQKLTGNISGSDDENSVSSHHSKSYSPVIKEDEAPPPKKQLKLSSLVTYGGHEDESDHKDSESETEEKPDDEEGDGSSQSDIQVPIEEVVYDPNSLIPPSPPGKCDADLTEKIARMAAKTAQGRFNLDAMLQRDKAFRNPSIYEKLISHVDLNEKGTNYSPELYDPSVWSSSSFYDELAKQQNSAQEKHNKDRKKIEFISVTKVNTDADSGNRKSKWDTGANQNSAKSGGPPPVGSLIKKK